jgi:mannose-1-phosphate guanylyltransferase
MNILILAGGAGTRLWPASRRNKPKQLLPFIGNKTLLQNTYERFSKFTTPDHIFIGTLNNYAAAVKKQLPQVPAGNYSLEPVLKDRAPAIGLAALIMEHRQPGSCFVTAWSDHYIKEEKRYLSMLKKAEKYLLQHPETTITVGATPTFAHTGMGYIERGASISAVSGLAMAKVRSFKEKPDSSTAQQYLARGNYLWNTGYFIWNTQHLLWLYEQYLPELYALLMKIKPALGTKKQQGTINKIYPRMPKLDIEKGLIEKASNRVAITADFTWADVGSWKVIKDVLSSNYQNLINGPWVGMDTEDALIYNYTNKLVATAGIRDSVVVVTDEVVLVADKNKSEEIKKLISVLESDPKLKKYL